MLEVTQNGFYKLRTGKGILRGLCALSLFGSYSEKSLNTPTDEKLPLRSIFSGQGSVKCGGTKKCQNRNCLGSKYCDSWLKRQHYL